MDRRGRGLATAVAVTVAWTALGASAALAMPLPVCPTTAITLDVVTPGTAVTPAIARVLIPMEILPPALYKATIDWGDGTVLPATVAGLPGCLTVTAAPHAYAAPGTYTARYRVQGPFSDLEEPLAVRVSVRAPIVSLERVRRSVETSVGEPWAGELAAFEVRPAIDPSGFVASISWGDGTTSPGQIAAPRPAGWTTLADAPPSRFTVHGEHTYEQLGELPVVVTVTGPAGAAGTASLQATVAPPPWGLASLRASGATLLAWGAARRSAVSGVVATVAASDERGPEDVSATVRWGDGKSTTATVRGATGARLRIVAGHTYDGSGVRGPATVEIGAGAGVSTQVRSPVVTASVASRPGGGAAAVTLRAPGAVSARGALTAGGRTVGRASASSQAAGTLRLRVPLDRRACNVLAARGVLRTRLRLGVRVAGSAAADATVPVVLRRAR